MSFYKGVTIEKEAVEQYHTDRERTVDAIKELKKLIETKCAMVNNKSKKHPKEQIIWKTVYTKLLEDSEDLKLIESQAAVCRMEYLREIRQFLGSTSVWNQTMDEFEYGITIRNTKLATEMDKLRMIINKKGEDATLIIKHLRHGDKKFID